MPARSVVKTRMQSLRAKTEYRNALHCAYRIATEEGVLKFWKGTVPRLGRLIVSHTRARAGLTADERRYHLHGVREGVSGRCGGCAVSVSGTPVKRQVLELLRRHVSGLLQRTIDSDKHACPIVEHGLKQICSVLCSSRGQHAHVDLLALGNGLLLFPVSRDRGAGEDHHA